MLQVSDKFQVMEIGKNRRKAIQLTIGAEFCYPLYYFVPSLTSNNRYLIYHRSGEDQVQLHRLDLHTAESVQITNAAFAKTQWYPWCTSTAKGVLDHRSVLNVARNTVIYFEGNHVREVDIESLADRELFCLPDDRIAIGQNCCSPDGKWFFYIHHDKELYDQIYVQNKDGQWIRSRHLSRGTCLAGYNIDTGEHRSVIWINSPIHHVQTYKENYLVFSSHALERSILVTDYNGGWYTHLSTQTHDGGTTCHYCATPRGIMYEAYRGDAVKGGIVSPETHRVKEFQLPASATHVHVGFDPCGERFIYETTGGADSKHGLYFLTHHTSSEENQWGCVFDHWQTYGGGQKSHFHPRVIDQNWVIITAGDDKSQSNHLHLVDISDVPRASGLELM